MKTKVGVISLGCDKNRIDTEVMLANLAKGGYQITNDQNDADGKHLRIFAIFQRRGH